MKFIEIKAFELNCHYSHIFDGSNCLAESLKIESPNLKITKVNGEHVKGFSVVETFYIIRNQKFKYLPIGLNVHFPKLIELIIKDSSLRFISKNDFYDLNFLEFIDFSRNQIETIPSDVFSTLLELENLEDRKSVV